MFKRALLIQLLLLATYYFNFAQPLPENYQPLKSTGEIPKDMIIKSSKKYEIEKSTIDKSESKRDRKSKESFYLSTYFEIDKMLLSGMVSFNDPITVYLNKIVDLLLKDEPALRKQVRVYTMKSPEVNAFATNQGIIFVNLGLLAKVQSEAELAFILAHEIIHVEKKHSLNKYLKVKTIERDKELYNDLSLDDKLATVNHYSRELETEADEHGLTRFLKAGYSLDAIGGAFQALAYSHRPFVEDEFDYKWLESGTFTFPEEFDRKRVNLVKGAEDEDDDSTSTHPSVEKRQAHIQEKTKDVSPEGRKLSIVSEAEFMAAREFSQFEICRLHVLRQRYDLAIYEAQVLLKQYPDNLYLKKLKLKAMAAMAYYTNSGISISEWEDYVNEDQQGNLQRAYHFFLSLAVDGDYIATVATRYSWQLKQEYPQDKEIATIADSMMHLLFYEREVDPEFFSMTERTQAETDSIQLEYVYDKDPAKRPSEVLATIVDEKGDTITEGVEPDSSTSKTRSTLMGKTIKTTMDDATNEGEVVTLEEEFEEEVDTVLATTVAEAKKLGIKLTGYEKYQLKHREKYQLKGIKRDGTMVYDDSEDSYSNDNKTEETAEDNKRASHSGLIRASEADSTLVDSDTTLVDGDTSLARALITAAIDTVTVYYHDFEEPIDEDFHKYAFVDFADDESFMKRAKTLSKQRENDDDFEMSKTQKKDRQKERELNENRGFALDIDKVVIINPRYSKINLVNQEKQQYLTSEKNQKRFSRLLTVNADASGIKYELIDNKELKNKETAEFNDIAFLNEWVDERLDLGSDVPLSSMELSEREALVKKYGTRYFMWTGNLSVKEKDYRRAYFIMLSTLYPVTIPFLLPSMIRGGKYQIYYYIVFDIIENKMVLGDVVTANQLERNDFLNSQIYYTFHQLNYKR